MLDESVDIESACDSCANPEATSIPFGRPDKNPADRRTAYDAGTI